MLREISSCLVLFAFVEAASADTNVRLLGFDDLNKSQLEDYRERVDDYAFRVSAIQYCGKDIEFEKKVVDAVRGCVSAAAIRKAVADYRERFRYHLDQFGASPKAPTREKLCSNPDIVKINKGWVVDLLEDVEEMRTMCKRWTPKARVRATDR